MNLQINNTSFGGKREIEYGLKMLADGAAVLESNRVCASGPRPVQNSVRCSLERGKAEAYADMIIRDCEFEKSIDELSKETPFIKSLREKLKSSVYTGCGYKAKLNPLSVFRDIMTRAAKAAANKSVQSAAEKFLQII